MPSYVIVGSSRGLGYEWLRQLSQDKSSTVIGLVRDVPTVEKRASGDGLGNIHLLPGDMSSLDSLNAAAEAVSKLTSSVDYLIINGVYNNEANAGFEPPDFKGHEEAVVQDFHTSLDVNVLGLIYSVNAFLPLVKKSDVKKIIYISTGMADADIIFRSNVSRGVIYSAIKAAANVVVAKYAVALKNDEIIMLALSPGFVDTKETPRLIRLKGTEEEKMMYQGLAQLFKKAYPKFEGPATPAESVIAQKKVIEGITINDSGAFISHKGNKEWL